ncbi:MAG: hypothetical protein PG981_000165 [Wolbachia endosymbiont of Ctenocephalides orientis wCori]|nr:MAG: hypothetical protein PG981_000165 [Wolbachia endosymbiont of Ctenocephalides orientis wCori]
MGIGKAIAELSKKLSKWRSDRIKLIGNDSVRDFSYLLNFIALATPFIFIAMNFTCIVSGVVPPITALSLPSFAVFLAAVTLPVVLGYSIGAVKAVLNYKLSKELKKEGVKPSRILDLFICVKDLKFTVEHLNLQNLMLIFDCGKLDINDIRQILNNKEAVQRLNSINKYKLKLVLNSDKLNRFSITETLNNQETFKRVNSINEGK